MRQIQAEYGQPISRQIRLPDGATFDGAFWVNHIIHLVEVKYTRNCYPSSLFQQNISRIITTFEPEWRRFRVVFAIVYGGSQFDPGEERDRLYQVGRSRIPRSGRRSLLQLARLGTTAWHQARQHFANCITSGRWR